MSLVKVDIRFGLDYSHHKPGLINPKYVTSVVTAFEDENDPTIEINLLDKSSQRISGTVDTFLEDCELAGGDDE